MTRIALPTASPTATVSGGGATRGKMDTPKMESTDGGHVREPCVLLRPPRGVADRVGGALTDIVSGARMYELWGLLGWYDILARYRRSILGPLWLTISMAVVVSALGFLYSTLFQLSLDNYLPHLASGFLLWWFVQAMFTEGCNVFVGAEGSIKQVELPYSIHVYRLVWSNLIVLGHNAVVFVVVALIFAVPVGWHSLWILPGMCLFIVNAVWVCLLFAVIAARFRDVPPIVGSLIQLSFFMTPIIWKPEILQGRSAYLDFNPFYHVLETVRSPLLGAVPDLVNWTVSLAIMPVGLIVTAVAFAVSRHKLAYWL